MRRQHLPTLTSPLLNWALRRARRGEADTKTIVIIVLAIVGGVMLLACVGVMAMLFFPAFQGARGAAQRTQGRNNLKMMGLALHNYHEVYSQFPPAGIYDEDETAYHSWQAMLLPYMDQAPLYNQIDFNRPWVDPANDGLFSRVIPKYLNPSITAPPLDTQGLAVSHYAGNSQLV